MNKQYKFDNAYSKVYEYREDYGSYVFIGSYFSYGITKKMREKTKVKKVNEIIDSYQYSQF